MYEKIAEVLTPKVEENQFSLSLTKENQGVNKIVSLVSPPLDKAREESRRKQCINNLKQLGLAMHNFHAVHSSFPPRLVTTKKERNFSVGEYFYCRISMPIIYTNNFTSMSRGTARTTKR
jgi:hypothetical protein